MGTMLYAKGIFLNRSLRRAEPDAAGPGRRGAPGLRPGGRRRHRDEHVRRQPDQARRVRARRPRRTPSTCREPGSPGTRRATTPTWPAPSGRSACASSRGARPGVDEAEALSSASRRRRSSKGASISSCSRPSATSTRSARRFARCAASADLPIVAQMTTEEDGNTLDGVAPESLRPRPRAAGRRRGRCQLQRRARRRCSRRSSGWRQVAHGEALGAAQRRTAARDRGAQPLSLLARLHGLVRAPVHQQRRAPGRRLLRHDAGAHPRRSRRRCGRWRRRDGAAETRRSPRGRRRRTLPPVPRAEKSRMAHGARARRLRRVSVELVPPRGFEADRADRAGAASCAPTVSTS